MSKERRVYFPNYQLRKVVNDWSGLIFRHADLYFVTKMPLFGATATQKDALRWASYNTPPVICVSHEAPTDPDRKAFGDPEELHRSYNPYAMAIATLECLGEETPRKIKIYFCDVELHEENAHAHNHSKGKGVYIEPLP